MELYISWLNFFKLVIVLALLFLVLNVFAKLMQQFFRRSLYKQQIKKWCNIVLVLYVPLAMLTIIAAFVTINYQIYGVLVLVVGIVLFRHIKNYCSGILFKTNPLVDVGVHFVSGEHQGKIEKLLPFGLIIKVESGERFINYSTIDQQGFCVNQKVKGSTLKTLYILGPEKTSEVLDVLFENPLIDFSQKPSIWNVPGETSQQLQFKLEKGAKIESIIDYLNQFNIKSSITKH